MERIKVIFLDIDGVLNDSKTRAITPEGFTFVDTSKILRLKRIVRETGAKLVLSSDWRYQRDDPLYNMDFLALRERLAQYDLSFYDYTPEIDWEKRGLEIQTWLEEHPEAGRFVILDDRGDLEPNLDRLVQTNMRSGLTDALAGEAIRRLNGENDESADGKL